MARSIYYDIAYMFNSGIVHKANEDLVLGKITIDEYNKRLRKMVKVKKNNQIKE